MRAERGRLNGQGQSGEGGGREGEGMSAGAIVARKRLHRGPEFCPRMKLLEEAVEKLPRGPELGGVGEGRGGGRKMDEGERNSGRNMWEWRVWSGGQSRTVDLVDVG